MLIRLRSTTIGLLGLVTVVGLGLVAFVSQIGWPGVLSGPLPAAPTPGVVQNDTIALQAEAHPLLATRGIAGRRPQTTANRHGETTSGLESDVAGADQLTRAPAEPPASPDPGPSGPPVQPTPTPTSEPTGQEPPSSAPAPGVDDDGAEEPSPVAAGSDGKSRGRDKEKARERDDRRGDSGDRRDDRRGDSDDDEDERSYPEDRWDGDDDDSDEADWDDDQDWDDDHDHDDWHRGKSGDRRD